MRIKELELMNAVMKNDLSNKNKTKTAFNSKSI